MAYIKTIGDLAAFNKLIASPKLTVVDYHATWCRPCQTIAPVFQQLSTQFKHVNFAKVDVDHVKEVATKEGVTSMPTFKFYKNGNEIAKLTGANPGGLKSLIEQHAGTPEEGGSSSLNVQGHTDINEFITIKQVDCLNQQEKNNVRNIFDKNDMYLESDVDEQLLISIPFNQAVKIHSIILVPRDMEHAPKTIKIYANRLNIGFDETDSIEETQSINLTKTDYEKNDIIPLRFVKFQNITNIALFVMDNLEDEETTIIKELRFIGSPVETTNMEQLKKIEQ